MNNSIIPLTKKIAEIASNKGINHVVLSPGSRSAPITIAFVRHPRIKTYIIPDERSAGYIASGMSLLLNQPVGLVSTSGTAAINLYSSVAEAYYQNIPLVVLTADRPPEWVDQADGQTIHQDYLFGKHVKEFFSFPSNQNFTNIEWYAERIMNEAINLALNLMKGPVHINIPIREPFYPAANEKYMYSSDPKIMHSTDDVPILNDNNSWDQLRKTWDNSKKVLIVGGQLKHDDELLRSLKEFSKALNVPIIGDCISNLHDLEENTIKHHDLILNKPDTELQLLTPDLLITFGRSVLSKKLKLFLRKLPPTDHWHIQEAGYCPDTFQSLTNKIRSYVPDFFNKASEKFKEKPADPAYLKLWQDLEINVSLKIRDFFSEGSFSELEAVFHILEHLPENINLHLANSMPVRLVNLIGYVKPSIEVFSNRGISGIDGCTSTAVGASIHSEKLNVLISGDMAFFYDRNGLWHNYIPGNLRIIILNNHGGGIFRLIDGPSNLPELDEYFETNQNLLAKNTAHDFGMDYFFSNDLISLEDNIGKFLKEDGKAKILEIETNSQINKTIFDKYISQFK